MTSWRDRLGRRRQDDGEDAGDEAASVRLRAPWSTRAAQAALWLVVAAGPLAGGVALADRSMSPSDDAAAAVAADRPSSSAAEGVAEMVVAAWLAGDDDTVAAFSNGAGAGRLDESALRQRRPRRTAVVDVDQRAAGYWAVTVAVDVVAYDHTDDDPDGDADGHEGAAGRWRREGLRFFRVGVAETNGRGLMATSLPAEVAGPSPPDQPVEPAVDALGAGAVDEAPVQAVDAFLGALLAGDGDADRYTAPAVDVAAVSPAPHADVEVVRAGTVERGQNRRLVRVQALATDEAGRQQLTGYSLEVARRQGRWEVTALHPAAAITRPQSDPGGE